MAEIVNPDTDASTLETYGVDVTYHQTHQRNVLGTWIGCTCDWCAAKIRQIEQDNIGHKIQGAR